MIALNQLEIDISKVTAGNLGALQSKRHTTKVIYKNLIQIRRHYETFIGI